MIRHLLKLVWNRKRANGLLILEIFLSFLVVFAVSALGFHFLDGYRSPLGFDWRDAWLVEVKRPESGLSGGMEELRQTQLQLLRELESWDRLEAAAATATVPYDVNDNRTTIQTADRRTLTAEVNDVTVGFAEVLDLEMVAGRWFESGDEALGWQPVVLDLDLARALFGDGEAVGQPVEGAGAAARVVGVVSDFRKGGELGTAAYFLFRLRSLDRPAAPLLNSFVVRVPPGTTAAFEEPLLRRLEAVARSWSFQVKPLERMREASLRLHLAPLVGGAVVAAFLLLMVGLGLSGVLWQSIARRHQEIGLRRATGASAEAVRRQILLELLILTTLGLGLGLAVVVQLPLLQIGGLVSPAVFLSAAVASLAVLYLLAVACGLYPAWMATRILPAEALRSE